jgi:hypothetical protein
VLALLILNGSIDTRDLHTATFWNGSDYVEDLSFNDVESMYELVTECLLDMEDFVPEHDDDSGDTDKTSKTITHWINANQVFFAIKAPETRAAIRVYPHMQPSFSNTFLQTETPPPDNNC